MKPKQPEILTPREKQLMQLLIDGYPLKKILADMHIGLRGYYKHCASIKDKFKSQSILQAVSKFSREYVD